MRNPFNPTVLWWELVEQYEFLKLNGWQMRLKTLPVVAATINGIALRIADIAEFQPREEVRLGRPNSSRAVCLLFVYV